MKNGIMDVVKAMVSLGEQYKFIVAGSGEQESEIKTFVAENKLDNRVILLGDRTHDEIIEILHISHLFYTTISSRRSRKFIPRSYGNRCSDHCDLCGWY